MSYSAIFIIILALGMIVGGVLVLKKSAKKFNLTEKQLAKIKARNKSLDKEEADSNQTKVQNYLSTEILSLSPNKK